MGTMKEPWTRAQIQVSLSAWPPLPPLHQEPSPGHPFSGTLFQNCWSPRDLSSSSSRLLWHPPMSPSRKEGKLWEVSISCRPWGVLCTQTLSSVTVSQHIMSGKRKEFRLWISITGARGVMLSRVWLVKSTGLTAVSGSQCHKSLHISG